MGLMIEGKWHDRWYGTEKTGGRFVREDSRFRGAIAPAGSEEPFPAEAGRYHLYVSYACPWAHRTLIFRALKGLEGVIDVSVVDPRMGEQGWVFGDYPGATGDKLGGRQALHQVYRAARDDYTGRVTVPVLWDTRSGQIVNNESAEIIRFLNGPLGALGSNPDLDLYPEALREAIDAINTTVYRRVNNGVYRAGFATTQEAYEEAVEDLFGALDELEQRLSSQRYLVGPQITEADWRLFTTLIRFDAVYHGHFKCNLRRIADYPNLSGYTRELYQWPGVAPTVHFDHIKVHYYWSHTTINPHRVVPRGPDLAHLRRPHGRERLPAAA